MDEGHVELDRVEGNRSRYSSEAAAYTEAVERHGAAQRADGSDHGAGPFGVADGERFGDLEFELRRGQAVAAQAFRDVIDQPVVQNLARREIDREAKGSPRRSRRRAGLPLMIQRPASRISPVSSSSGMNWMGGSTSRWGWRQRSSGFGADDPARLELELGLVEEEEFLPRQRLMYRRLSRNRRRIVQLTAPP